MSVWTVLRAIAVTTALFATGTFAGPPSKSGVQQKAGPGEDVRDVFAAHNRERAEAKLNPLAIDPKLTAAALAHAEDMASCSKMTHEGSDGSTPAARVKRQNYDYQSVGENVAEGYRDVTALMRGWMESPHHRDNILGKFTQIGIAVARDESGAPFWCVDFGTPWEKLDPARAGEELVRVLNKERSAAGLRPLVARAKLNAAATRIVGEYSGADTLDLKEKGEDLVQILKRLGYRYRRVAESAAAGQPGVAEVAKTWMGSASLREQVLGDFTDVGIGCANSRSGKPYWCLVLARPQSD